LHNQLTSALRPIASEIATSALERAQCSRQAWRGRWKGFLALMRETAGVAAIAKPFAIILIAAALAGPVFAFSTFALIQI